MSRLTIKVTLKAEVTLKAGQRVYYHDPMAGDTTVARITHVWPPTCLNLDNDQCSVPHAADVRGASGGFWTLTGHEREVYE